MIYLIFFYLFVLKVVGGTSALFDPANSSLSETGCGQFGDCDSCKSFSDYEDSCEWCQTRFPSDIDKGGQCKEICSIENDEYAQVGCWVTNQQIPAVVLAFVLGFGFIVNFLAYWYIKKKKQRSSAPYWYLFSMLFCSIPIIMTLAAGVPIYFVMMLLFVGFFSFIAQ